MRLCIDCKHIRDADRATFEKCAALPRGPNLVTGEDDFTYCSTARTTGQECGPEGLLWEPRHERARCKHDNIVGECNECDVAADFFYDEAREDRFR